MVSTFLWARDWKWPMNNNYQFQPNISVARSNKQLLYCLIMHGEKSWDTFAFLGHFPIHTCPAPRLTPQAMLDACIQNFFRVSTLYWVGKGRTAGKFRKGCTVLWGNTDITENYEYYIALLRTFVQDWLVVCFLLSFSPCFCPIWVAKEIQCLWANGPFTWMLQIAMSYIWDHVCLVSSVVRALVL